MDAPTRKLYHDQNLTDIEDIQSTTSLWRDFVPSTKGFSKSSPKQNKGKESVNYVNLNAKRHIPLKPSGNNDTSHLPVGNHYDVRGGSVGMLTIAEFPYLVNPRGLCPPGIQLSYVVCVLSAPANFEARQELRQTWAAPDLLVGHPSRLVFIMGRPSEHWRLLHIRNESRIHGDIVMEDFVAAYDNLTYSSIAALRWVTYHCPNVSYVIKADDDVYVNIFKLIHTINTSYINESRVFLCAAHYKAKIRRQSEDCQKFCVPNHILPNRTHYPTYCAGPAYIFPRPLGVEIYNATRHIQPFEVEDVYITGILREHIKAKIQWIQNGSSSLLLDKDVLTIIQKGRVFPNTTIIHDLQHRPGLKPRLLAENINNLPLALRSMISQKKIKHLRAYLNSFNYTIDS